MDVDSLISSDEEDLPPSFVERIECQKGQGKLDLTLCQIRKVPVNTITKYFGKSDAYNDLHLDLSFNLITSIPASFVEALPNLTKLDLRKNKIKKLPENFGDLAQLVYLDLHGNELKTLPLSMAKMCRLKYLCLSDNPFRPPLKSLLDSLGNDMSGLALADFTVNLLRTIANAVDSNENLQCRLKEKSSKVRYRRRHSSRRKHAKDHADNSTISSSSNSSDVEEYDDFYDDTKRSRRRMNRRSNTYFNTFTCSVGKTVFVTLLWGILIPLMVAYVADTSYLEQVARDNPAFDAIWTGYNYKGIHYIATKVIKKLPENKWALKGETLTPLLSAGCGLWCTLLRMYSGYVSIMRSMWNWITNLSQF